MWPDRVSNPGPLTYESGALPTALRGPASRYKEELSPGQHDRSCTTVKILGIRTDSKIRGYSNSGLPVQLVGWLVVLLFYDHGKHLRSCRDGQLT